MRTLAKGTNTVLVNLQRRAVNRSATRGFIRKLRHALRIEKWQLNVCLVDDRAIRRLNRRYRGQARSTDVLAFPWERQRPRAGEKEMRNFLGDIVISVETASRNARVAGQSALDEIHRLILHGALHLLGYNHDTDGGEMARRERFLRERLGVAESRSDRCLRGPRGRTHG